MGSMANSISRSPAGEISNWDIPWAMPSSCSRCRAPRRPPRRSDGFGMRRLTTVALVAGTLGLGAMGVLGQPNVPPPTHLGGAYWKQLSPTERDAYLAGFLAGAAAEQARAAATTIDTLRAQGTLRYR